VRKRALADFSDKKRIMSYHLPLRSNHKNRFDARAAAYRVSRPASKVATAPDPPQHAHHQPIQCAHADGRVRWLVCLKGGLPTSFPLAES